MSADHGFCILDNKKIRNYHLSPAASETQYNKDLNSFIIGGYGRPSMEAGFHSIINHKYVIHSHAAYLNVLLCTKEIFKTASNIFKSFELINFCPPGKLLANEIQNTVKKKGGDTKIFFLKNHGLITSSNDLNECLETHQQVNILAKEKLDLNTFSFSEDYLPDYAFSEDNILFPDQVVFINNQSGGRGFIENYALASFIEYEIRKNGFTPNYIDSYFIQYIQNMDAEKHRKSLDSNGNN